MEELFEEKNLFDKMLNEVNIVEYDHIMKEDVNADVISVANILNENEKEKFSGFNRRQMVMIRMMRDEESHYLESLSYLFNNFNNEEEINKVLDNIIQNVTSTKKN